MGLFNIVPYYVQWHYTIALNDFYRLWSNALWFIRHFFSISVLLHTLFLPFERLHETYEKGFNLENFFAALVVNTLMRIVGAIVRLFFVALGIIFLAFVCLAGFVTLFIWFLFPIAIALLFIMGLSKLLLL